MGTAKLSRANVDALPEGFHIGSEGGHRSPLGLVAGLFTAVILFVADSFPDEVREEKQEP